MKSASSPTPVDVYAYNEGTFTGASDSVLPHKATFQLQCISCDEWEEPDHDEWLANLKPEVLQDLDDGQASVGTGNTESASGNSASSSSAEGLVHIEDSNSGGGSSLHELFSSMVDGGESSSSSSSSSAGGGHDSITTEVSSADTWKTRSASTLYLNCVDTTNEASCHNLAIEQDGAQGRVAGDVCVSVNPINNLLQVTATTLEDYSLVRTQLWVSTSGIEIMPTTSTGRPDTKRFPIFQCDSDGLSQMRFELPLEEQCTGVGDLLSVTVMLHAVLEANDESDLDPRKNAFATQNVGQSPVWYGYIELPVRCGCDPAHRRALLRHR